MCYSDCVSFVNVMKEKEKFSESMNINVKSILEERLANSLGLDKYQYIMSHFKTVDVSKDADFQSTFNGFYIVRRNEEWRKAYYNYFENTKNGNATGTNLLARQMWRKKG